MSGDGGGIRRRDEILEALYWLRGEGLAGGTTLADLARLLGGEEQRAPGGGSGRAARDPVPLADDVAALERAGLVRWSEGALELTDDGAREGGRRFADAFAGLTAQAHGECSDPDCACHDDPAAALDCHLGRAEAHARPAPPGP